MSRIAVFVSGNGTHLPWLLEEFDVVAVVCNNPRAPALEKTEMVHTLCLDHKDYSTREAWEEVVHAFLLERKVELIVLAGFMRILTASFVRKWPLKIVNVHPALLPAFPGAHAIQDALNYGAKITGCTVHFVDEGVDTGPILAQGSTPVLPEDTVDSLKKRIGFMERSHLRSVLWWVTDGRFSVEGRRVLFT